MSKVNSIRITILIEKSAIAQAKQPVIPEAATTENGKKPKKKKGLEELDLDYEEMFDDDQEEDIIVEEESESSLDEANLAEDGKMIKHNLEQEEEPAKPMNLNFEVEIVPEDKNIDDDDSSMASIFGDEVGDEEGGEVGSKRGLGESTINGDSGLATEAKRQKKSS